MDELREIRALIERTFRIGHQVQHHAPLLEHYLLYAELLGDAAQRDGAYQLVGCRRHRPEAVLQATAVGVELLLGGELV